MKLILAGSRAEFNYLCRRKGLRPGVDAIYADSPKATRGRSFTELWTYGNYYTRADYMDIEKFAVNRGLKIRRVW